MSSFCDGRRQVVCNALRNKCSVPSKQIREKPFIAERVSYGDGNVCHFIPRNSTNLLRLNKHGFNNVAHGIYFDACVGSLW